MKDDYYKISKIIKFNNAIILSDILDQYGYTQIFAMGSEKQFEDRDILLENHKISIHDLNYYKNKNIIPQDYHVFWGIEDYKLFEIAKEELTNLGKEDKPFSYSLLTVDSHFPSGFTCNECETKYDKAITFIISLSYFLFLLVISHTQKTYFTLN